MIIYITFGSYISKEYYKLEENVEFWAWEENVGLPLTWLCNTSHNLRVNIYYIYLCTQKDLMKFGLQNVKLLAKYYDQNICKKNVAMMPLTRLTISRSIHNIM